MVKLLASRANSPEFEHGSCHYNFTAALLNVKTNQSTGQLSSNRVSVIFFKLEFIYGHLIFITMFLIRQTFHCASVKVTTTSLSVFKAPQLK